MKTEEKAIVRSLTDFLRDYKKEHGVLPASSSPPKRRRRVARKTQAEGISNQALFFVANIL